MPLPILSSIPNQSLTVQLGICSRVPATTAGATFADGNLDRRTPGMSPHFGAAMVPDQWQITSSRVFPGLRYLQANVFVFVKIDNALPLLPLKYVAPTIAIHKLNNKHHTVVSMMPIVQMFWSTSSCSTGFAAKLVEEPDGILVMDDTLAPSFVFATSTSGSTVHICYQFNGEYSVAQCQLLR